MNYNNVITRKTIMLIAVSIIKAAITNRHNKNASKKWNRKQRKPREIFDNKSASIEHSLTAWNQQDHIEEMTTAIRKEQKGFDIQFLHKSTTVWNNVSLRGFVISVVFHRSFFFFFNFCTFFSISLSLLCSHFRSMNNNGTMKRHQTNQGQ